MSNPEPVEGKCNYHPTQDDGYCAQVSGMGTDHLGEGYCKYHGGCSTGGAREGAGAPKDNTNAVTHALFAKANNFYQDVIGDDLRELCNNIYDDYLEKFQQVNGDPITGEKARLFEISVNHIKIIHADNWAVDKPSDLESGNPMVDRESTRKFVNGVGPVTKHTYSETVVVGTQQKLRREDRAWLRDYNLLDDPESQKADAIGDLKEAWVASAGGSE